MTEIKPGQLWVRRLPLFAAGPGCDEEYFLVLSTRPRIVDPDEPCDPTLVCMLDEHGEISTGGDLWLKRNYRLMSEE